MRKTPESISKARQKLKNEIDTWKEAIRTAENSLQIDEYSRAKVVQQVLFGKTQLLECKKQMAVLKSKGKKKFWQKVD